MSNWPEYGQALVQRGDITLWVSEGRKRSFRVIASWRPTPTGLRGAQRKFSDHAIETALTLRPIFRLPLRQAEGFLRSVLPLLGSDQSGLIIAQALTHGSAGDAKTVIDLIDGVEGDITSITADAACDTLAIYDASAVRSAKVVVLPIKTATRL